MPRNGRSSYSHERCDQGTSFGAPSKPDSDVAYGMGGSTKWIGTPPLRASIPCWSMTCRRTRGSWLVSHASPFFLPRGTSLFRPPTMRVVKARAALLSDLEVLQLLRETEEQQKTQARHRKEETDDVSENDVPPNLRTIQFEVRMLSSHTDHQCSLAGLPSMLLAKTRACSLFSTGP